MSQPYLLTFDEIGETCENWTCAECDGIFPRNFMEGGGTDYWGERQDAYCQFCAMFPTDPLLAKLNEWRERDAMERHGVSVLREPGKDKATFYMYHRGWLRLFGEEDPDAFMGTPAEYRLQRSTLGATRHYRRHYRPQVG